MRRMLLGPASALVILAAGLAAAQQGVADGPLATLGRTDTAGLIAFVLPGGRPALVDPSSGERVMLDERASGQFPAWSPAGDRVSFITFGAGGEGAGVDVFDPATGTAARVYERARETPIYHGWSPDGARIAVLANRPGGLGLHLVDARRTAAEAADGDGEPFAVGAPFYWDWTPSGERLLVHRNVLGPTAELGLTGLEAFEPAGTRAAPGAFQSPAVAPSGAWIAYASLDAGGTRRVVLERVDGVDRGETFRELPHVGLTAFAWHPRRDQLALQRPLVDAPHSYGPIALLDAATGDLEALTDDVSLAFWWSPDGGTIAYLSPVPAGPGGGERQVAQRTQASAPRVALRVVDVATGLRRELGRVTLSPLFQNQYLPFFDQYARSHRLWSPSSDAVVLPVMEGNASVLTVFSLDGGVRVIGAGDMPAWNVR